jgi:hypothetical protein
MFYIEKNGGQRLIGYTFRVGYTYRTSCIVTYCVQYKTNIS